MYIKLHAPGSSVEEKVEVITTLVAMETDIKSIHQQECTMDVRSRILQGHGEIFPRLGGII